MTSPDNNLFARLHKWAWRQDENFLTESLAFLLQHLLEHEPGAAVRVLEAITNGFLKLKAEQARSVIVQTQLVLTEGTPDLRLKTEKQAVIIEVKSESPARADQIRRYRQSLQEMGVPSTCLVLLTRYPAKLDEADAQPDVYIRWYQVVEWLECERHAYKFQAVSEFLAAQFLGFLEIRSMSMGQVTWELTGGVRALRTLADMLYESAVACGAKAQIWGNRDEMGIHIDKPKYWVGIRYNQPELVTFWTWRKKVNPELATALGFGKVTEWDDRTGWAWSHELNLQSEEIHFFARSKASQLQMLESFLRKCLDAVREIELPGVALPPEDEDDAASEDFGPETPTA
jgi:hypothetical protein